MYSLETIQAMNAEAEEEAREYGLEPYEITEGEVDKFPPFPFPKLGDYVPAGWERVDEFFVDSSGWGSEGEPALTVEQFKDKLVAGRGYAITSEGQFQVYVGEYIRA